MTGTKLESIAMVPILCFNCAYVIVAIGGEREKVLKRQDEDSCDRDYLLLE